MLWGGGGCSVEAVRTDIRQIELYRAPQIRRVVPVNFRLERHPIANFEITYSDIGMLIAALR